MSACHIWCPHVISNVCMSHLMSVCHIWCPYVISNVCMSHLMSACHIWCPHVISDVCMSYLRIMSARHVCVSDLIVCLKETSCHAYMSAYHVCMLYLHHICTSCLDVCVSYFHVRSGGDLMSGLHVMSARHVMSCVEGVFAVRKESVQVFVFFRVIYKSLPHCKYLSLFVYKANVCK